MLRSISIRNLFLIDQLEINFENGFTVITGESGSGKSMIIRSLSLLAEPRASAQWLRQGAESGSIEAIFSVNELDDVLYNSFNSLFSSNLKELTVRREIKPDNRSRCFINDELVSRNELTQIVHKLIHFSLQEDVGLLRDKDYQLFVLDQFGDLLQHRKQVEELFSRLVQLTKKVSDFQNTLSVKQKEIDWVTLELTELENIQYQKGEERELQQKIELLKKSNHIKQILYDITTKFENTPSSLLSEINDAIHKINSIIDYHSALKECITLLENAVIGIKETLFLLHSLFNKIQEDPIQLEQLQTRLNKILEIERKWRITATEIPKRIESLKQALNDISKLEQELKKIEIEYKQVSQKFNELANVLSKQRKIASHQLIEIVKKELPSLGIPDIQFDIQIRKLPEPNQRGIDDVEFLFSANPDYPLVPLSDVISGGELSRLELVILSNLGKSLRKTFLFDEIDRGVSGKIAAYIGYCLQKLSEQHQIIIVSHLPQVVAAAHHQILIEKKSTNNITRIFARPLTKGERVNTLAEMLSGEKTGIGAVEGAKELLSSFHKEIKWNAL